MLLLLLRTAAIPDGPAIAAIGMSLAVRRVSIAARSRQLDLVLGQRAVATSLSTRDVSMTLAQRRIVLRVR